MTILIQYPSKKILAGCVGSPLIYRETSSFDPEFLPNGTFSVAYRPSVWKDALGGREFFARVTMSKGLIAKVE